LLFLGGVEQGFTKFFISFVEKEEINKNPKDSVYSMLFYWIPMLIGRILCTFLTASWINPYLMLALSLFFCLLTYILWIIFIWYIGLTRLSVFLLVTANGLSISSISPTTIGWIKQFLSLSPIELTLILSSNSIGGIVFGLISGYVFQHYGSKHLFTLLILLVMLMSIFFIFTFIIQYFHSKQTNQNINQHDQTLQTFIQQDQTSLSDNDQITKYIDE
jgi:fucose permease